MEIEVLKIQRIPDLEIKYEVLEIINFIS